MPTAKNNKKKEPSTEAYAKCKYGGHAFGPTGDPWYEKCYKYPAIRKKDSIKIKSVK